jgi:hypothetical protein
MLLDIYQVTIMREGDAVRTVRIGRLCFSARTDLDGGVPEVAQAHET